MLVRAMLGSIAALHCTAKSSCKVEYSGVDSLYAQRWPHIAPSRKIRVLAGTSCMLKLAAGLRDRPQPSKLPVTAGSSQAC